MSNESEIKWEFYQDGYKNWRWRKFSGKGHAVFECEESYSTRKACVKNARQNGFTGKINKYNCKCLSFFISSI
jgi:hypothetical protein